MARGQKNPKKTMPSHSQPQQTSLLSLWAAVPKTTSKLIANCEHEDDEDGPFAAGFDASEGSHAVDANRSLFGDSDLEIIGTAGEDSTSSVDTDSDFSGTDDNEQTQQGSCSKKASSNKPNKRRKRGTKRTALEDNRKWNPNWGMQFKHWLVYDVKKNVMFCSICKKHQKNNDWAKQSQSFRIGNLKAHANSKDHIDAIKLEASGKTAEGSFNRAVKASDEGVKNVISNVYFAANNDVALRKVQFLNAHSKIQGAIMPNTMYQNATVAWQIVELISSDIENDTVTKIRPSFYSIIIDESTDISIHKNLVIYTKFLNDGVPCTAFLKLLELESAGAEDIENAVLAYLRKHAISLENLIGFGSDGASVMLGNKTGVATRLLKHAPYMTSSHCAAHKLQLAVCDAAGTFPYLTFVDETLSKVYKRYSKSSTNRAQLKAALENANDQAKSAEFRTPNLKRYIKTRWLSRHNCVEALVGNLPELLVDCENNAPALYARISSYKFVFFIHIYLDILVLLYQMSIFFQRKELSITEIVPSVVALVDNFEEAYLAPNGVIAFGTNATKFYNEVFPQNNWNGGIWQGKHLRVESGRDTAEVIDLARQFARELVENLRSRFPSSHFVKALRILSPLNLPSERRHLHGYGDAEIEFFGNYYGKPKRTANGNYNPIVNAVELAGEWTLFRLRMHEVYKRLNFKDMALVLTSGAHPELPNITKLFGIVLILPGTSVDAERGFSKQNIIKTKLRNRFKDDHLDCCMRISIQGPAEEDADFAKYLDVFKKEKSRHLFKRTSCQQGAELVNVNRN